MTGGGGAVSGTCNHKGCPYDGLLEDSPQRARREEWIPAFAGMTDGGAVSGLFSEESPMQVGACTPRNDNGSRAIREHLLQLITFFAFG